MSKICLIHNNADELLEMNAMKGVKLEPSSVQVNEFSGDTAIIRETLQGLYGASDERLNVLVGDASNRGTEHVSYRTFAGDLPEGSILRVSEGVYVASPEFNLLLQAKELHPVRLCQLLGRYWGTFAYGTDENGAKCLVEREPLSSEEKLASYLAGVGRVEGIRALRNAMRYACENAASPQEVNLQLALCLPATCNGYALRKPIMNYEVTLDEVERELYDKDSIRIDLHWPGADLGLEFLGKKEHEGKMMEDIARWYAARHFGEELWFVTKEQLYKAIALDFIAKKVARRTRKKVVEGTWPTLSQAQLLLDVLSGKINPKPEERLRKERLRVAPKRGRKQKNA